MHIQEPVCSEEGVLVLLSSRHIEQTGSIVRSVEVGCFYRIVVFFPIKILLTCESCSWRWSNCGYHLSHMFGSLIQELQDELWVCYPGGMLYTRTSSCDKSKLVLLQKCSISPLKTSLTPVAHALGDYQTHAFWLTSLTCF